MRNKNHGDYNVSVISITGFGLCAVLGAVVTFKVPPGTAARAA